MAPWSIHEPFLTAATIPNGMASPSAMIIAATASSAVAGIRSAIIRATGVFVRNEVPRSPRARPATNVPYCT